MNCISKNHMSRNRERWLCATIPATALLFAVVSLVSASPTFAKNEWAPSESAGLIEIYEQALGNDASIRAAEIQTFIGQREYRDALYGYFPRVYGQLDYSHRNQHIIDSDNDVFSFGRAEYSVLQGVVEFRQPLLDYERISRVDRGDAIRERSFAEFASARQLMILKVAESYFKALLGKKKMSLVSAAKRFADEELRHSKAKLDAGEIAVSDYKDVEAQSYLAQSELIDAQNEYRDLLEAMRELTGELPADIVGFHTALPIEMPEPLDPEHWVKKAIQYNHDLRAQDFSIEAARAQRDQALGDVLPKLEAVGTYDYTDQEGSRFGGGSRTEDTTLGVRLTVPLFNADDKGYTYYKESHQTEFEQSKKDQLRRKIIRQTRNFYQLIISAARKYRALSRAVDATHQRLSEQRQKRGAGKITSVDVLEAQRDYLRAQRDLFDVRIEYILNLLNLKANAGNLTEEDLKYLDDFLG